MVSRTRSNDAHGAEAEAARMKAASSLDAGENWVGDFHVLDPGIFRVKINQNRRRSPGCCAPERDAPAAIAPRGFSSVEPVAERGLIGVFMEIIRRRAPVAWSKPHTPGVG